jgi:hypothetical protein
MNKVDLNDLLAFAERNRLMDKKFQEVYSMYTEYKQLEESYEDALASMIDSSIEQHELDFSEAV